MRIRYINDNICGANELLGVSGDAREAERIVDIKDLREYMRKHIGKAIDEALVNLDDENLIRISRNRAKIVLRHEDRPPNKCRWYAYLGSV